MRNVRQLKAGTGVLILAALALLYIVPVSLLVRRPDPGVTEIYFADRITDAHRILIDRYNALHAGRVRVIPIDFPNADFSTNERKEILARSLRGEEDGIDLLGVDVIWVKRFARWCEPLGRYFTAKEIGGIVPDALYSCYVDSTLAAVPLDIAQNVLYYRDDLLRGAPGGEAVVRELRRGMTWPAFLSLRGRLGWKRPFYIFPAADYEGLICSYIENLLSLRPDYFATAGFDFDTPDGRRALQLLVDLVGPGGATPPEVTSFIETPSYAYYVRNDALFLWGWTTYDKDFRDQPFDREKQARMRQAPLPRFAGGSPASMFGGWNLMVSRFSKKKSAVVDFVKFLLRDDSQEVLYTEAGYYPVVKSFYDDSASVRRHPEIAEIRAILRTGVHRPVVTEYTNYSKIMSQYFSLALRRKISVEEAVRDATRAIRAERSVAAGG
ncbi:MAG TPA: extracellular solute-binding protein [Bacteroidota bacterium]|nr:extracellular solute-binding protein [Bacteroidota bacterium]